MKLLQFLEATNPNVKVKKDGSIYNAYLQGRRVGQAQVYDYEDEKVGEDERYIWKSATHPEYTRQGVATELYNVIADDLASQGLKLVPSPDQQLSGDAYEFWKARDPESIKGHGTYKAEQFQHYIGKEIEVRGRPSVVTRVGWVNDAPLIGARFTDVPEGSTNSHATVRFADVADQFNEDEKISLPDLEAGDELMVGKFKNRKATIKGFKKDKNNQPVAKTNKGDQQIFKGRVKKLMDESFDRTTTEMPDYDDLIKSIGDEYKTEYFRDQKGKEAKMVDISPDQYLQAVDRGFEHGVMSGVEDEKVQRYAAKMKAGETFPALTLDYSRSNRLSQEGRHRALAAKAVGIDSVPVLVVTPTQEEAKYLGITEPNPDMLKTMEPRPMREGPVKIGGASKAASSFMSDYNTSTVAHPFMPSSRIAMNSKMNTGDDFAILEVQPYGDDRIYLGSIQSSQAGNGNGSAGLKLVTDLADKNGVVLELDVDAFGEAADKLTNSQLRNWYSRAGFAPVENKHVADRNRMERQPQ